MSFEFELNTFTCNAINGKQKTVNSWQYSVLNLNLTFVVEFIFFI